MGVSLGIFDREFPLFDRPLRGLEVLMPLFNGAGSENIEALVSGSSLGCSPITRAVINRVHSESRSATDVEGGPGGVGGVRVHWTGGIPGQGRSGGGYVVGNA